MDKKKQIRIRKPFSAQYVLIIEMESAIVDAKLVSVTEARYNFSVLKVEDEFFECRLLQTDLFIKEANSDLVKEVAAVTAVFNKMFNELHLRFSHNGDLLEILNLELILSKWQRTKEEIQSLMKGNQDLSAAMAINDSLVSDVEKLKSAIMANEFLSTYFGKVFDISLPVRDKMIAGTNIFNTTLMNWMLDINTSELLTWLSMEEKTKLIITSRFSPAITLNESFSKAAYKQFGEKIEIKSLKPELGQDEERSIIYQTGQLLDAKVHKKEFAHERLFNQLSYHLMIET